MAISRKRISENLAHVRERIAAAAARSGRGPEEIKLVAVTKYVDENTTRMLFESGCQNLGESRPQDLWRKAKALGDLQIDWHMIGHLQRNKVRQTVPLVSFVHSGDSLRLLKSINEAAKKLGRRMPLLLEVNVSGDQAKHGFSSEELERLLPEIAELHEVDVRGLMCMAGLETNAEGARREFAELRELRDRLMQISPKTISLAGLSMGMSRDFEIAIEEGATMVRIGSALYAE